MPKPGNLNAAFLSISLSQKKRNALPPEIILDSSQAHPRRCSSSHTPGRTRWVTTRCSMPSLLHTFGMYVSVNSTVSCHTCSVVRHGINTSISPETVPAEEVSLTQDVHLAAEVAILKRRGHCGVPSLRKRVDFGRFVIKNYFLFELRVRHLPETHHYPICSCSWSWHPAG